MNSHAVSDHLEVFGTILGAVAASSPTLFRRKTNPNAENLTGLFPAKRLTLAHAVSIVHRPIDY
jgi:hypothetical protein